MGYIHYNSNANVDGIINKNSQSEIYIQFLKCLRLVKLFSFNWKYWLINKNGVFHTTSCEVVQIIWMISESVLMLKALSRKEHNIASIKREIRNSLLVGISKENVRWMPYY